MHEQQRQQRAAEFLAEVQTVHVAEKAQARAHTSELTEHSRNVLIKAALEPGLPLTEMYRDLTLHPAEGKRAVNDLVARGFARTWKLCRQGRGGQPQALSVLPQGEDELAKYNVTPAEKMLKRGGWKHDVYCRRYVLPWIRKRSTQSWIERWLGPKAFDVVYQDAEGKLWAIEITCSGTAQWNATQAVKGAGVAGIEGVTVACENRTLITHIEAALGEADPLGLYRNKVTCRLLSDFLAP